MKILIVGLGSIGKRHVTCLQKVSDIEVAVLRSSSGTLKDKSSFREFYNIEEALIFQPDGVIISNPTSLHVKAAIPFLQRGVKTLIEKPIAHSIEEAGLLHSYRDNLLVAYCLRFLPLSYKINEILSEEKMFKLSFKRSYYLPKWHPYADYRTEYTAKKNLGGGVIRTLSHEIDLMLYLCGEPISAIGVTDKISPLEIDTDDFAFFTCKMKDGSRINFELDFFSPQNINTAELFTEKGKYCWDFHEMIFTPYEATTSIKLYGQELFDFEEMYDRQMKDFINFIKNGKSDNATFEDGLRVLNIINKLK